MRLLVVVLSVSALSFMY